jgi:hypothetical protein
MVNKFLIASANPVAAAIGEELRGFYELPQTVPPAFLTLLTQIGAESEGG